MSLRQLPMLVCLAAICVAQWKCAGGEDVGERLVPLAEPLDAFAGCWLGTWRQHDMDINGGVRLEIEIRAEQSFGRLELERNLLPADETPADEAPRPRSEGASYTELEGPQSSGRAELTGESEAFGVLTLVLDAADERTGAGTLRGEGQRDGATLLTLAGDLAGTRLELEYAAYVGDAARASAGSITLARHACGSEQSAGLAAALNDPIFFDPDGRPRVLPRDQSLAFYLTDALERARALSADAQLEIIRMRRPNSEGRVVLEVSDDPNDASSLRFSFANSQEQDLFTVDYFAQARASSFPRTTLQNGAVIYQFLRDRDVDRLPTEAEIAAAMAAADCPLIGELNSESIDIFRAELQGFPGEELYVLYTRSVPEVDRRGWLGHVTPDGLVTDATLGPGTDSNCGRRR